MKHSGAHNALEQTMHLVFLLFGVVTIVGKLVGGVTAVAVAMLITGKEKTYG